MRALSDLNSSIAMRNIKSNVEKLPKIAFNVPNKVCGNGDMYRFNVSVVKKYVFKIFVKKNNPIKII